jgi:hypothetical protein
VLQRETERLAALADKPRRDAERYRAQVCAKPRVHLLVCHRFMLQVTI